MHTWVLTSFFAARELFSVSRCAVTMTPLATHIPLCLFFTRHSAATQNTAERMHNGDAMGSIHALVDPCTDEHTLQILALAGLGPSSAS